MRNKAMQFILLLGFISLLSDITYEGGRSIIGSYLSVLGASAAVVGFMAGLGEFVGYGLRLVSGYITDRTEKYWTITIIGYVINLLAVPLLALTGHWPTAATLMIMERLGKAIRTPARDAMLSHASHQVGVGWGFGLHEAMDQIGAMLGPLIVATVLYFKGGYRAGFALLAIPALLAILLLLITRQLYPHPKNLEVKYPSLEPKKFPQAFWYYVTGAALVAAGYADFPLIAYHFQKKSILSPTAIPIAYAIAMGISGFSALILGYLYDRLGFIVLIFVTLLSALFAPMVFLGGELMSFLGVILWGIGMGGQQSLMRAVVANMIEPNKRASAYGIFNMAYGMLWFLGSFSIGLIYDRSIPDVVIFILAIQLLSLPWLILTLRKISWIRK